MSFVRNVGMVYGRNVSVWMRLCLVNGLLSNSVRINLNMNCRKMDVFVYYSVFFKVLKNVGFFERLWKCWRLIKLLENGLSNWILWNV